MYVSVLYTYVYRYKQLRVNICISVYNNDMNVTNQTRPIYREKMILIRRYRQVEYNTCYSFTMKIIRTFYTHSTYSNRRISIIKYHIR